MVSLQEHIAFLKALQIPHKATVLRYLKNFYWEHLEYLEGKTLVDRQRPNTEQKSEMTFEDFMNQVMGGEPHGRVLPSMSQTHEKNE